MALKGKSNLNTIKDFIGPPRAIYSIINVYNIQGCIQIIYTWNNKYVRIMALNLNIEIQMYVQYETSVKIRRCVYGYVMDLKYYYCCNAFSFRFIIDMLPGDKTINLF